MILLDTHVVLWLTSEPTKLSGKATAIEDARTNGGGLAIPILLFWSWLHSRTRVASVLISALRPSCVKLRLDSWSCPSLAVLAPALWNFQPLIPKIQRTALSPPRHWWKVYP